LSRKTMCDWMAHIARMLNPIFRSDGLSLITFIG
jgi:hypothetical protein